MSRSLRRGALAAALTLSIAPLAACGAGADSQTLQVQPNTVKTTAGVISIQNAVVVTEPNGGPASVTARIFNNGNTPQQLTAISVQGSQQEVKLTGADGKTGPLTIPANGSIGLGGAGNASAIVQDAQQAGFHPGTYQSVVLDFSQTGNVTVSANVVPAVSYFKGYGPGVTATPATPSAMPTGSAKPGVPASPAGSAPAKTGPSPSATH